MVETNSVYSSNIARADLACRASPAKYPFPSSILLYSLSHETARLARRLGFLAVLGCLHVNAELPSDETGAC